MGINIRKFIASPFYFFALLLLMIWSVLGGNPDEECPICGTHYDNWPNFKGD